MHPLEKVSPGFLRHVQIPSVCVALLCLASLPPLLPGGTGHALLELVEAGDAVQAKAVVGQWSEAERSRAAFAVGLDFLMNPAYMNALAIAVVWSGRVFAMGLATQAARVAAWAAWSVVLTNVVENVGLLYAITGETRTPWPALASAAHGWATLVITACVAFAAAGAAWRLARRGRSKPTSG